MLDEHANEETDGGRKKEKRDSLHLYMCTDTHLGYWFISKVSSAKRVADTQALCFIRCGKAGRADT